MTQGMTTPLLFRNLTREGGSSLNCGGWYLLVAWPVKENQTV